MQNATLLRTPVLETGLRVYGVLLRRGSGRLLHMILCGPSGGPVEDRTYAVHVGDLLLLGWTNDGAIVEEIPLEAERAHLAFGCDEAAFKIDLRVENEVWELMARSDV